MAQRVKDPVLSMQWLSLDPWSGNLCMPGVRHPQNRSPNYLYEVVKWPERNPAIPAYQLSPVPSQPQLNSANQWPTSKSVGNLIQLSPVWILE